MTPADSSVTAPLIAQYVDLMLAPSGKALIPEDSEPAQLLEQLQPTLESCSTDVTELIAALSGLELLTETDPQGVVAALGHRADEVMPVLALFLACTPYIGTKEDDAFATAALIEWKCSSTAEERTYALTPQQGEAPYFAVITSALAVLRVVCVASANAAKPGAAKPNRDARTLSRAFVRARHAGLALSRCVALIGEYKIADADGCASEALLTAALLGRETLCALATEHEAVARYVDSAVHPFDTEQRARALIEAMDLRSPFHLAPLRDWPHPSALACAWEAVTTHGDLQSALDAEEAFDVESARHALEGYLHEDDRESARLEQLDRLFAEGVAVTFAGLGGRAELNGHAGKVVGARPQRSDGQVRYPVQPLSQDGGGLDAKPILVQPINLRRARATSS